MLYTLASVVDDTEMGVTHVVRGSDHVTNTATQIQMIDALGGTVPRICASLASDRTTGGEILQKVQASRLCAICVRQGVEPMALLSLMARLGSSDPVELHTEMAGLIEGFDIGRFRHQPPRSWIPMISSR